jgi:myo-inositol-1(or 4)-monophosphatase
MIARVPPDHTSEMLNLAVRLSCEATTRIREFSADIDVQRKPDDSVVTRTDHALQSHMVTEIQRSFPGHAIVAEETRVDTARLDPRASRFVWVIDPLDGTRNYAVGFPCFATSIAVLEQGRPLVGVVREHNTGRTYAAIAGRGATVDGGPLVRRESPVSHDHLVGISSTKDDVTVRTLQALVPTKGLILRNLGSAAMHLALVADGGLRAAFGVKAKIWDLAAGAVLVSETGGVLTDLDGQPITPFDLSAEPDRDLPFLCGCPAIHARVLSLIQG